MGCLLVLLAAFAPRLIVVFAWIARPVYFDALIAYELAHPRKAQS